MLNNKVEQRTESMPIVYESKLAGIVVSGIVVCINLLNVVKRHFVLKLWA